MKISRESGKAARRFYRLACDENERLVPARVVEIADRLVAEKPRGFLGTLKEFTRLVRLELSHHHARVVSASPLDAEAAERFAAAVRRRFGGHVTLEFAVDPALLGGVRVQVGNDVWDGTLRTRLENLKRQVTAHA